MNHGVVGYESGADRAGAGTWAFGVASGERPALIAPRGLERADFGERGVAAGRWRRSFIRSLGNIDGDDPNGLDEYGRYEPMDEEPFCRMCRSCIWGPMNWALAVPPSTRDEVAVKMMGDFLSCARIFHRRFLEARTIAPLMRRSRVESRWALLLGFDPKEPYTVFAAPDGADVDRYRAFALRSRDFRIVEEW